MAMTAAVKDELNQLEITKPCCRKAETSAMLRFGGALHIVSGKIVVEAEFDTGAAARRLRTNLSEIFGQQADFAVVHTATPARAEALLALDDAAYLAALQTAFGHRLALVAASGRARFPLQLRMRRDPVGERLVWLGNAAQTLHPVAGQGFNLALRDVWALAGRLRDAADPGDAAVLAGYLRERRVDRAGTAGFTDTLVRVFSNDLPPLRAARGLGLLALDLAPPLRHFLAKRMMFGARAWP